RLRPHCGDTFDSFASDRQQGCFPDLHPWIPIPSEESRRFHPRYRRGLGCAQRPCTEMPTPHPNARKRRGRAACDLLSQRGGMRRTILTSVAAGLIALMLAARPAASQKRYDPGASDTEIKIGHIVPYRVSPRHTAL